jgi:hypothetical protein
MSSTTNQEGVRDLAGLIGERDRIEQQRKKTAGDFKKKIKKLDVEIAKRAAEIRGNGAEQ